MTDLICRKSMTRCLTPGMCSPHGGCRPESTPTAQSLLVERDRLQAEVQRLEAFEEAYKTACDVRNRLIREKEEVDCRASYWRQRAKSAEGHIWASDAKAAHVALQELHGIGAPISVQSAVLKVLSVIEERRTARLPRDRCDYVWCACGDGYQTDGYDAGFMAANNGVCPNCEAAIPKGGAQ